MLGIRYLRLKGGADVICKIIEDCEGFYKVETPVRLMMGQGGQTAIVPYLPYTSEKVIIISKMEIEYNLAPADDIANMWNEKFGSGVVITKPSLVLPK